MQQSRRVILLTLLAAALLCAPTLAQGVDVIAGVSERGVWYTIAVPATWNGGLVFYNHGFDLSPASGPPSLGELQELQLLEGFAIAASGFRQVGWAVFESDDDLEELYQIFSDNFGPPGFTIVYGPSAGGAITVRAIEQAEIGNVIGAMPFCGAVAGSRNWDLSLDARVLYDAICQDVPGANIPGGAEGLPLGTTLTPTDNVLRANVCFGHDLPRDMRTADQQKRLDKFLGILQIPQSFINTSLAFYTTFAMSELVHNPGKLGGEIGFGNRNVDYGDPVINADIQRVAPRAAKRKLLRENFTPKGKVGATKILSIHTDQDGLVIVENESEYAKVVPRGNLTVGVVREAVPSHCGFTGAELVAAWETLRGWLAGDPQPSALTLQIMCLALETSFGGPCRFDPTYQIPDMDGRIRPRNPGGMVRARNASVTPAPAEAPEASPGAPVAAPPAAQPAPADEAPAAAPAARPERAPVRPAAALPSSEAAEVEPAERFTREAERRNQ